MVDFYAKGSQTGFLRRFRTMEKVLYQDGPDKIMAQAQAVMQTARHASMRRRFMSASGTRLLPGAFDRLHNATYDGFTSPQIIVLIDARQPEGRMRSLSLFFRNSWQEVPDSSSPSRYMAPKFVQQHKEEQPGHQSDGEGPMMPYLAFGTYVGRAGEKEPSEMLYNDLLTQYTCKNNVIHGTRTLDEFYYHFADDDEFEDDMFHRNGDQVTSKEIHGSVAYRSQYNHHIVTHRPEADRSDDLIVNHIVNRLDKDSDKGKGTSQPKTAHELTEFIVDCCVGFYDLPDDNVWSSATDKSYTVRQIFSDAISKAALKEAQLFNRFTNDKIQKEGEVTDKSNQKRTMTIDDTAYLLCGVKDICDELGILKAVAAHQKMVQDSLLSRQ
ncbi:hypothetical protein B0H66DRAFT_537472 [Apodospora peruviana]|uniref:Uncharacterized protein n=1 Tax=Apodospora peruviana TaxID=516989 RepID=A0AAE0HWK1_9PEZI|nr:hypothetical protein B0H66DRAFT_537472 [Apodospora peruviana]